MLLRACHAFILVECLNNLHYFHQTKLHRWTFILIDKKVHHFDMIVDYRSIKSPENWSRFVLPFIFVCIKLDLLKSELTHFWSFGEMIDKHTNIFRWNRDVAILHKLHKYCVDSIIIITWNFESVVILPKILFGFCLFHNIFLLWWKLHIPPLKIRMTPMIPMKVWLFRCLRSERSDDRSQPVSQHN